MFKKDMGEVGWPIELSLFTSTLIIDLVTCFCSIRLTTFDTVKGLIAASEKEFKRIVEENCKKQDKSTSN